MKLQFSTKVQPIRNDIYLFIELYEKNFGESNSKSQLVQFCGGKCGKKRKEVIELQDRKIYGEKGVFQFLIAINEQCAHRSNNGYGSPNTRFYFQLQLWESDDNNELNRSTSYISDPIKVVAPGKGKWKSQPATKKAKSGSPTKLTVRDMMEMLVKAVKSFDNRLSALEAKYEEMDQYKLFMKYQMQQFNTTPTSNFSGVNQSNYPPEPVPYTDLNFVSNDPEYYIQLLGQTLDNGLPINSSPDSMINNV